MAGQGYKFSEVHDAQMEKESPFLDRSSVNAYHERNEMMAREYMVAVESMHLVGERLAHCFRTEGVNHYVNCKDLREKYAGLCKDRFRGMILPPDSQPVNRKQFIVVEATQKK